MTIETKPLRELAQTCVVTAHSEEKGEILIGSLLLSLLDEIDKLREQRDKMNDACSSLVVKNENLRQQLAMVEAECRELLEGFTCDDDYQMAIRDGHEEAAERILAALKRVPELENDK